MFYSYLSERLPIKALLHNPQFLVPHVGCATLLNVFQPLRSNFESEKYLESPLTINGKPLVNIKAIVLDKDNCLTAPERPTVSPLYLKKLAQLSREVKGRVMIVSNSAGYKARDPQYIEASAFARHTGVHVLKHIQPKPAPGCTLDAMWQLYKMSGGEIHRGDQVLVIGDRIFTDVLFAKALGAWSIWLERGVVPDTGILTRFERSLVEFIHKRYTNRHFTPLSGSVEWRVDKTNDSLILKDPSGDTVIPAYLLTRDISSG